MKNYASRENCDSRAWWILTLNYRKHSLKFFFLSVSIYFGIQPWWLGSLECHPFSFSRLDPLRPVDRILAWTGCTFSKISRECIFNWLQTCVIGISKSCDQYSKSCVQCTKIIIRTVSCDVNKKIKATWCHYIKKCIYFGTVKALLLSRLFKARGSFTGPVTVGPTKV